MTQRILITGAGGYIGRALCRSLSQRKDLKITGTYRNVRPDEVAEFCELVFCDLVEDVSQLPNNIDLVVHAAACLDFEGIGYETLVRDNIDTTRAVIRFCKKTNIKRCIFLSSTSVYGAVQSTVVDEATELNPSDDYGKLKKIAEIEFCKAATDLSTECIRLPAVIGPNARRIFPARMMDALETATPMTFYNPSNLYNHLVDLDDVATLISTMIDEDFKLFMGFPIAAAEPITMSELVTYAASLIGAHQQIEFEIDDERVGNVISSLHAQQRYGFQPQTVKSMISRFIFSRQSLARSELSL